MNCSNISTVVICWSRRARQISIEAEKRHEPLADKPVTLAIREVADGELTATLKEEYLK